jgi:membrane protease YdiL (CAAX protease family)
VRGPLVALGVALAVAFATTRAFAESRAGTWGFWLTLAATYGVLAVVAIVRAWRQDDWAWLAPKWGDFTRGFFGAAILFGVSFVFVKLFLSSGPREAWMARVYAQMGESGELRTHFARVALLLTGIAFCEEVVWRGMVTSLLEERLGSRRAWLASTLLYSVSHIPTAWVLAGKTGWNPTLVLAAIAIGLVMGGITRQFQRVPPAMVAHALFLIAATMMFRLTGTSV